MRRRRRARHSLPALLAAVAELLRVMRALDADERAAGRTLVRRLRGMRWGYGMRRRRRLRPSNGRRGGFVMLNVRWLDHRMGWVSLVPAVNVARWRNSRVIVRLPDDDVLDLFVSAFGRAARPPIGRTRVIVAPHNEIVIVPIEIVV